MKPGLSYLKSAACAIGIALAMPAGHVHAQQVPIPQTAAEVRGPAPGPMTKAYVQLVGRIAPPLVAAKSHWTGESKLSFDLHFLHLPWHGTFQGRGKHAGRICL